MQRPHCEEHPQVPALARCSSCGKYLCGECVVEESSRAYCAGCAEAVRSRRESGRTETPTTAPPPPAPAQAGGEAQPYGVAPVPIGGGPVGAQITATCFFHPGVRAVTRCSNCGALICAGCQRAFGAKRLCERCFTSTFAPDSGASRTGRAAAMARGNYLRAAVPWRLWPGLAFLPVPFILNGLMTYMMRQGEEVSVGAATLLASLLLYSSTLAFAFIAVSRYGSVFEELGMHGRNLASSLGLGFIGGSLTFWLSVASAFMSVAVLSNLESVERWLQGFFDVNVKDVTGIDMVIAGIIIVIAAPICEEIFFRGYLYPAMRNNMGLWGAVFLNGFLFSAVHFSVFGLLGRTIAGVIFCLLYEYNDNLWSPITAHAINNFVAFFLPLVAIWSAAHL